MAPDHVATELHRLLELAGVDPDEVTSATPLGALHLDSLDYTEIREAVRTRFGVDVRPDELHGENTVGEATEIIRAKVVENQ